MTLTAASPDVEIRLACNNRNSRRVSGLRWCETHKQTKGTTTHFVNIAVRTATDSLNQFVFFLRISGTDVRAHGGWSTAVQPKRRTRHGVPQTLLWTDDGHESGDGGDASRFGRKNVRKRGR